MSTPRKRLFTHEFALGDYVTIVRTKHGWLDGEPGTITKISEMTCSVTTDEGYVYEIVHPRDICKISREKN